MAIIVWTIHSALATGLRETSMPTAPATAKTANTKKRNVSTGLGEGEAGPGREPSEGRQDTGPLRTATTGRRSRGDLSVKSRPGRQAGAVRTEMGLCGAVGSAWVS